MILPEFDNQVELPCYSRQVYNLLNFSTFQELLSDKKILISDYQINK